MCQTPRGMHKKKLSFSEMPKSIATVKFFTHEMGNLGLRAVCRVVYGYERVYEPVLRWRACFIVFIYLVGRLFYGDNELSVDCIMVVMSLFYDDELCVDCIMVMSLFYCDNEPVFW